MITCSSSVRSSSSLCRQSGSGMSSKISSSSDLTSSVPSIIAIRPRFATESALAAASRASASARSLLRRSCSSGDTHLVAVISESATWSTVSGSSSGCRATRKTSSGSSMPSRRSSPMISPARTSLSLIWSIELVFKSNAARNLVLNSPLRARTRSPTSRTCAARRQCVVTSNILYSRLPPLPLTAAPSVVSGTSPSSSFVRLPSSWRSATTALLPAPSDAPAT
mmetsp:Transcript_14384/g.44131  ORF Transcript_14384/g.44131 Transcript_14384/m.44131 type:complete len:224 (+) Transcript_14384:171-842(+)